MAINRLTRRGWNGTADPSVLEQVEGVDHGPLDDLMRNEQKAEVWAGLERSLDLDREHAGLLLHSRAIASARMSREFEARSARSSGVCTSLGHRLRDHLEGKTNLIGRKELGRPQRFVGLALTYSAPSAKLAPARDPRCRALLRFGPPSVGLAFQVIAEPVPSDVQNAALIRADRGLKLAAHLR